MWLALLYEAESCDLDVVVFNATMSACARAAQWQQAFGQCACDLGERAATECLHLQRSHNHLWECSRLEAGPWGLVDG